jgi:uncharacterized protein
VGTGWQAVAAEVRAVDSAAQIPAVDWDDLTGADDLYLARPWLRMAEATSGVPMTYLLGGDERGLTSGLPTALLGPEVPWLLGRPDTLAEHCAVEGLEGAADFLASLSDAPCGLLMPSLVCGGRHLGRTRVLTRAGLSDAAGATERLVVAAEELMRERQARSVAFLYVDERDSVLRQVLAARGYASFVSSSYSWLPVPDGGFDGYTATLSRHRRHRVKPERRRLRAAGVEVRLEPLTADLVAPVAAMDVSLLVKYGARATQEQAEQTFDRIRREFGADATAVTARLDGELCGFGLVLRHHDHWYVYRCGFDYAVKGDLPIYFEMLYYHLIEAASAAGASVIHYGTGSAEAKRSRGCLTTRQYAFVMPGQ